MSPAILMLIPALIAVESGGNARAVGDHGKAWGCLQISQSVLDDVNRLNGHVEFRKADCFRRSRAVAIFCQYVRHYATSERLGHEPTPRDAAMIWHWGPDRWNHEDTDGYWARVEALSR